MNAIDKDACFPVLDAQSLEDMKKYGISRSVIQYFHVGEYNYTSIHDAIRQAERSLKAF